MLFFFFLASFLVLSLTTTHEFALGANFSLPDDEVKALRKIAETLEKKDWNFDVDPCNGSGSGWNTLNPASGFENSVNCSCSITNDSICHVVSIVLKSQSLPGKLPPQLASLPYLSLIDLSRNYLTGTLPPEWGFLPLTRIDLTTNRISGPIPKEFGSISTLIELTIPSNQLSGSIPPELGNLPNIEKINLASNYLSGELPGTLGRLSALRDLRISDNKFSGRIPDYIGNWTSLKTLSICGSGFSGPIPSGIGALVHLTDLRISDLINGTEQPFPPIQNLRKLVTLILRNCNITDKLPDYLAEMTKFNVLDLSFNKLSGPLPISYASLAGVNYFYLTENLLTGPVPDWVLDRGDNMDLSYNKFTDGGSTTLGCQEQTVNLFGNTFKGNNSDVFSCLRNFRCPKSWYSLHINCGGPKVIVNGNTTYEDDTSVVGPSTFFRSSTNWAFSSTGHFMDDGQPTDSYTWANKSRLSDPNISELYMNARLSPMSLTYYGFCLGNGNYTLSLHFAEIIIIADDKTYNSLGRRIFDVYVQGKLILKDFNIVAEAGGAGKAKVEKIPTIVTNNTLEIRFYWAAKGTTGIPYRGVYGPLVSAISVDPDFTPPSESGSSTLTVGIIVGIVAAVAFLIFLILCILWWKGCIGKRNTMPEDLKGLDLQTGSFTLRQIKAATNNFDSANKIGEGGFGSVYKGLLSDGTVIAVKQLSSKSKQGNREFVNEIGMISAVQHPYLVKLYGCCVEGNQLLLVYEYMENNSLAQALFDSGEDKLKLDWPTRNMICIGIARGLAYLHEESRLRIVHRDIKATNVLLDKDLNPKISDFGLAKLYEEGNTHITTRIAGTFGYIAPEYALHGYLTDKADVYSFGIVALEIVSGRRNISHYSNEECFNLLDWALVLNEQGSLMELLDSRLGSEFNKEEAMKMVNVALLCTNISPSLRPAMSSVVSMLEGRTAVQVMVSNSSFCNEQMKIMAMKKQFEIIEEHKMRDPLLHTMSTNDEPCTASSSSAHDLYSVNMDSSYWEKRVP